MPSYQNKTDEELEALQYELDAKRADAVEKIRAQQAEIRAIQNERAAEARAKALLDGLSDSERDVIVKAVAMEGKAGR